MINRMMHFLRRARAALNARREPLDPIMCELAERRTAIKRAQRDARHESHRRRH